MGHTDWKNYLPEFREKTAEFYSGQISKAEYKGFSGFYGSIFSQEICGRRSVKIQSFWDIPQMKTGDSGILMCT